MKENGHAYTEAPQWTEILGGVDGGSRLWEWTGKYGSKKIK